MSAQQPIPSTSTNIKLLLIGSSSTGKTSVLLRYTDNEFLPSQDAQATIGVDYKTKTLTKDGKKYKLSLWDTAGQERFRTLTSSYYRGCHGVFLVYAVDNRESFDSLYSWFSELDTYSSGDVIKFVVGNKTDTQRTVSKEEAQRLAKDKDCDAYFEVSAKRGDEEIVEMFQEMINKIISAPNLLQDATRIGAVPGALTKTLNVSGSPDEASSSYCSC